MTIKAVIFDLGGVILHWNPLALYQKNFPQLSLEEIRSFFHEVDFTSWNLLQDKGRSFDEGVAELSGRFPHRAELIHAYHEHWADSVTGPIQGSVALIKRLKTSGRVIYGLTNFSVEKFMLTRQNYPFLDTLLDNVIVSGREKLIKPDPAIYQLTLERIGLPARECAFVDDSLPNVHTAEEMGLAAIHFQSPEQLEASLFALGTLPA